MKNQSPSKLVAVPLMALAKGRQTIALWLIAAQLAWGLPPLAAHPDPSADVLRPPIEEKVEAGLEEALASKDRLPHRREPTQTRRDFLTNSARRVTALAVSAGAAGVIGLGAQAPPPLTQPSPRSPREVDLFQEVGRTMSKKVIQTSLRPPPHYLVVNDTIPDPIITRWKKFEEEWATLLGEPGRLDQDPQRAERIRKVHRDFFERLQDLMDLHGKDRLVYSEESPQESMDELLFRLEDYLAEHSGGWMSLPTHVGVVTLGPSQPGGPATFLVGYPLPSLFRVVSVDPIYVPVLQGGRRSFQQVRIKPFMDRGELSSEHFAKRGSFFFGDRFADEDLRIEQEMMKVLKVSELAPPLEEMDFWKYLQMQETALGHLFDSALTAKTFSLIKLLEQLSRQGQSQEEKKVEIETYYRLFFAQLLADAPDPDDPSLENSLYFRYASGDPSAVSALEYRARLNELLGGAASRRLFTALFYITPLSQEVNELVKYYQSRKSFSKAEEQFLQSVVDAIVRDAILGKDTKSLYGIEIRPTDRRVELTDQVMGQLYQLADPAHPERITNLLEALVSSQPKEPALVPVVQPNEGDVPWWVVPVAFILGLSIEGMRHRLRRQDAAQPTLAEPPKGPTTGPSADSLRTGLEEPEGSSKGTTTVDERKQKPLIFLQGNGTATLELSHRRLQILSPGRSWKEAFPPKVLVYVEKRSYRERPYLCVYPRSVFEKMVSQFKDGLTAQGIAKEVDDKLRDFLEKFTQVQVTKKREITLKPDLTNWIGVKQGEKVLEVGMLDHLELWRPEMFKSRNDPTDTGLSAPGAALSLPEPHEPVIPGPKRPRRPQAYDPVQIVNDLLQALLDRPGLGHGAISVSYSSASRLLGGYPDVSTFTQSSKREHPSGKHSLVVETNSLFTVVFSEEPQEEHSLLRSAWEKAQVLQERGVTSVQIGKGPNVGLSVLKGGRPRSHTKGEVGIAGVQVAARTESRSPTGLEEGTLTETGFHSEVSQRKDPGEVSDYLWNLWKQKINPIPWLMDWCSNKEEWYELREGQREETVRWLANEGVIGDASSEELPVLFELFKKVARSLREWAGTRAWAVTGMRRTAKTQEQQKITLEMIQGLWEETSHWEKKLKYSMWKDLERDARKLEIPEAQQWLDQVLPEGSSYFAGGLEEGDRGKKVVVRYPGADEGVFQEGNDPEDAVVRKVVHDPEKARQLIQTGWTATEVREPFPRVVRFQRVPLGSVAASRIPPGTKVYHQGGVLPAGLEEALKSLWGAQPLTAAVWIQLTTPREEGAESGLDRPAGSNRLAGLEEPLVLVIANSDTAKELYDCLPEKAGVAVLSIIPNVGLEEISPSAFSSYLAGILERAEMYQGRLLVRLEAAAGLEQRRQALFVDVSA